MKNQRTYSAILTGAFLAVAAIVMPMSANAQLRYQNQYSKAQVGQIVSRLESSSQTFRFEFDRAMDNSNLNGTSTEDRYNRDVKNYADSLTRLRREFDRNNSWWQARNNVQSVIGQATTVNTWMNNLGFRRNIERQWNAMRNDVNTLADTFDLQGLEGGGWNGNGGGNGGGWNGGNNGGGWNGGGQMSSPPNWAQGTFYSTGGENISVTMDRQGRVTVVNGGQTFYGTYNRGNLLLNGDSSAVTRFGNNGFRTYNRNTGQYTNYTRDGNGGGNNGGGWNGGGNNGGGQMSSPPSWAQGTFYSTSGENITVTMDRQGRVTVVNGGQTFYGTYNRGNLLLNGDSSEVTKFGNNGFRTYNRNTGQYTNYTRDGNSGWNGDNNGGDNGGGNGGETPKWARGTFYNSESNIQLTISSNGQVTANVGGQAYNGNFSNGQMTLNGDTSTVQKDGDGIKTYNQNTGQWTSYRRN